MSGEISFSGLASGIDFDSMVNQLVEAEKFQAKRLESWKQEWVDKSAALDELSTKMMNVGETMEKLETPENFYARVASTSNSDVATVAVDSSATPGSYKLEVAESSNHILASTGFASNTSEVVALGDTKTINFDDGEGNTINVTLDGSAAALTLDDVATEIESAISAHNIANPSSLSNLTVDVESDNSSSNSYRLKLHGGAKGEDSSITINTDDSGLSLNQNTVQSTVEEIDKSGTASISAGGTYTGYMNKRITFTVVGSGTIGNDEIELKYHDPVENVTNTVTIPKETNAATDVTVSIRQGVDLTFNTGAFDETLTKGDTFAVDLFNPNIQLAQDSGLAQAEREVHTGFTDADTTAVTTSDATFTYSYAGVAVPTISVPENTTLNGLAELINSDPDNPGVVASVMNDGSGSANAYHLVMTSKNSGAAFKISDIDFSSFSAGAFSNGTFEETQSGKNALVKMDGYPAGDQYVQSSSNLVTNLIDGASLTLKSTGTTDITITNDIDAMTAKVKEFVDAYNDAMEYVNEITKVVVDENDEAVSGKSGILVGNYGVTMVEGEMMSFIGRRPTGFNANEDLLLLPQLGLSTGDKGLLEFDEDVFKDKLNEDADEVVNFFTADKIGSTTNNEISFSSATGLTEAGIYNYSIEVNAAGEATSARYWKDGETSADGWDLAISSDGKFATATSGDAKGMALQVVGGSNQTYNGVVSIKQGKAHEYDETVDKLIDEDEGTIKVLLKNYEDIITNIDNKIENELDRVKQVEKRLKAQFARLEVTMQETNSQMQRLNASMPSSV
jgi:flagellar hook-associated protein 2